ncbi:HAD-IB family phosphatase [Alkaliphilus pronyensis]|uniref:phosphoserine phosphatase n=1 Tax=Alkaliphilus pronyensis TaxID=1482732 RepID=A0A6I0F6C5_9FIRM|nr:HAD family phosphatase [Alkaliphilus pronyensis]KAB3530926.1 HAD-IB family phosphatase [Alkaliphilus pronyensis]
MERVKLVCFDLDDTLIREIHSVMLPCILNGKEKEHSFIQEQEEKGVINYISADYLRAELLLGLEENNIAKNFLKIAKPLRNIRNVVDALHNHKIKCIVITVGPKQVAKVVCDIWGFDGYYGSDYEVVDGVFTGKILKYIGAEQKIDCLIDYCNNSKIRPEECIAVGDGSIDIPVFKYCAKSIAINSYPKVRKSATYAIETDDLTDILKYII